jgi:hypothetical protein
VVLSLKTLGLLLESVNILVLELELLLETGDFASVTGSGKLGALLGVLVGTLVLLELLLKTEDLEDHGVGTVEDQGEEQGETAEVHVALRVELASLDFETLVAHDGAVEEQLVYWLFGSGGSQESAVGSLTHCPFRYW